jgi:hypothetical protein
MSEQKIDVEIRRDIWAPGRIRKGTITTVALTDEVLAGIESGAIRRVTPAMKAEMEAAKKAAKALKA